MRLFVGLDLPWEMRERLSDIATGIPGARWVPDENLHLTLRFIGEVDRPLAEEVDHALAALRSKKFTIVLTGVGTFQKGGRETTLWVGVERNEALDRLQAKIEQALQRVGLEPERRRFVPHVTLAKLDNTVEGKLVSFVQAHNLFRSELAVGHFTLFSSILAKEQPVYTAEVEYPLE